MVAFLYLILTIVFGCSLILRICDTKELYTSINGKNSLSEFLFVLPAGSVIGILLVSFFNYFLIYGLSSILKLPLNIIYIIAISIISLLMLIISVFNLKNIKSNKFSFKENVYYFRVVLFLIVMACLLIFYGYFIRNGELNLGSTIHSDLSPHTLLVETFGNGDNIPTQYPHFSNDGIRYHFLFYFFCGILKFLGMRLDLALNIPTIVGIVSGLMLAGLFATLLSKSKKAYFLAPLLILFRSSFDIFDMIKGKSLLTFISRVIHNSDWYHTTPYDEWGLWAINVYANQRHLMFAFAILIVVMMLFMPFVKKTYDSIKKYPFKEKIKYLFFNKDSWVVKDKRLLLLCILIAITLPYFHASILISLLLILFVMAIFSNNKLSYLIFAIIAILSTYIQTNIFSSDVGGVIGLKVVLGFVLGRVSIFKIIGYLLVVSGLTFVLGWYYIFKKKEYLLIIGVSCFLPVIFANLFQVSLEVLANHKFIQVSLNLFSIFVGAFLSECTLKNRGYVGKTIWGVMLFLLMATGISEWFIYINMNRYPMTFNEQSEVTKWIKKNTDSRDTLLTPYWAMHNVYLSGRQIYYGWPYYAWSAGHDTDGRKEIYFNLLSGCNDNIDEFVRICKKEKIKYLIDTGEYYNFDEIHIDDYHREYLTNNLKLVKEFLNDDIRIYKIY